MEADVKAVSCRTAETISEPCKADEHRSSTAGKNGYLQMDKGSGKSSPLQDAAACNEDQKSPVAGALDLDSNREQTTENSVVGERSIDEALEKLTLSQGGDIRYVEYESERQMPDITGLITLELSEPYSIYTYRYFLHNWPHLSYLAYSEAQCVGAVVCKLDFHQSNALRGYIAMLVVHKDFRRHKIGSSLVERAIQRMVHHGCDEIVLETEVTNKGALRLYENLGFVRDKRLLRYYLNGVDAWRLKLWLK